MFDVNLVPFTVTMSEKLKKKLLGLAVIRVHVITKLFVNDFDAKNFPLCNGIASGASILHRMFQPNHRGRLNFLLKLCLKFAVCNSKRC